MLASWAAAGTGERLVSPNDLLGEVSVFAGLEVRVSGVSGLGLRVGRVTTSVLIRV